MREALLVAAVLGPPAVYGLARAVEDWVASRGAATDYPGPGWDGHVQQALWVARRGR